MNDIGVFICNYNGIDWTIGCIESLRKQTMQSFDVHVVDNASTDGSVVKLKKKYGDSIEVLVNSENLGGAGGFDRGLRHGIKKDYKYIVLLDNDITLEAHTIENMYLYLSENEDVGIVGSKVMIMDAPELIQDYGCKLDFVAFKEFPQHGFRKENEVPDEWECDYVPTCAVMVRTSALRVSGTMPADNFIYYDDIELSHKLILNGYKVVALGKAKVFHKGGFRKAVVNTFPKYYFMRNRLHFFSKYVDDTDIERFVEVLLRELYSQLFGYYTKNMRELFLAVDFAFHDYLQGIRGKAPEGRVIAIEKREIPFENVVVGKKKICIEMIDNFLKDDEKDIFHVLRYLIGFVQNINPQEQIAVSLDRCNYTEDEFYALWEEIVESDKPEYPIPKLCVVAPEKKGFDLEIKLCAHIKYVRENVLPAVWVDRYANCITTEEEYRHIVSYEENESFFYAMYEPLMIDTINRIRKELK